MESTSVFEHNRVILCHFDSYSAASVFARYGTSILAPVPLPEDASVMAEPVDIGEYYAPEVVMAALSALYGYNLAEIRSVPGFQVWMHSSSGPIRIHLLCFTTLDAPKAAIEPNGGLFKSISEMRGTPMIELNLLRLAFDLVMSGG
ncbi:hypothetical protein [Sulfuriferula nivalis]|uniref:Uncharacterized protein n=1 Tax=Sulfuriferula nivalis TaxID=2675298 RepID=A0A809RZU0_9PROT|nr:hypothetical protein [Sulfuriferula nivalis]BBO99747.1 hypothetical protein SFSGTM_04560 [Sulfuriferula nivalis]